jgi:hypothetical protein
MEQSAPGAHSTWHIPPPLQPTSHDASQVTRHAPAPSHVTDASAPTAKSQSPLVAQVTSQPGRRHSTVQSAAPLQAQVRRSQAQLPSQAIARQPGSAAASSRAAAAAKAAAAGWAAAEEEDTADVGGRRMTRVYRSRGARRLDSARDAAT